MRHLCELICDMIDSYATWVVHIRHESSTCRMNRPHVTWSNVPILQIWSDWFWIPIFGDKCEFVQKHKPQSQPYHYAIAEQLCLDRAILVKIALIWICKLRNQNQSMNHAYVTCFVQRVTLISVLQYFYGLCVDYVPQILEIFYVPFEWGPKQYLGGLCIEYVAHVLSEEASVCTWQVGRQLKRSTSKNAVFGCK